MTLYLLSRGAYRPLRSLMNLTGESSVVKKLRLRRHPRAGQLGWDLPVDGVAMVVAEATLGLVIIMAELIGLIIMAIAIQVKHMVAIGLKDRLFRHKSVDQLGNATLDLTQGFHL